MSTLSIGSIAGTSIVLSLVIAVSCSDATRPDDRLPPPSGSLRISISTRGEDLDPDGYGVSIDGKRAQSVDATGSLTVSGLSVGSHTIGVEGIATNCVSDSGPTRNVQVAAEQETKAALTVSCVARIGSIGVSASTAGVELAPAAYLVRVDTGAAQTLDVNGAVTLSNVHEGTHLVTLSSIGDNCRVGGKNPQWVNVSFGATTSARFDVRCAPTVRIQVTTSSSGVDVDPDGYTLELVGDGVTESIPIPSNGTLTTPPLFGGTYDVTVHGISQNCLTKGEVTRQIDVAQSAAALSFEVVCSAATQLAFVRDGQIYLVKSNGADLVRLTNGDEPAWSPDGRRIAFIRRRDGSTDFELGDLYVMDADGSNARLIAPSANSPAWSPDSKKIAFSTYRGGDGAVLIMSVDDDAKPPVRIGFDRGFNGWPAWSPDGSRIAFVSDWEAFDYALELYVVNADGSNPKQLTNGFFGSVKSWPSYTQYAQPAWSPDGSRIALVTCVAWQWATCGESNVAVMNTDGSNLLTVASSRGLARPTWSPDGRGLAFARTSYDHCCRVDSVFFVRLGGSDERLIVSNGYSPSWRR